MDTKASHVATSAQFVSLLKKGLPPGYRESFKNYGDGEGGLCPRVTFYWSSYNICLDLLSNDAECCITSRHHNIIFAFYPDDYIDLAEECIQILCGDMEREVAMRPMEDSPF